MLPVNVTPKPQIKRFSLWRDSGMLRRAWPTCRKQQTRTAIEAITPSKPAFTPSDTNWFVKSAPPVAMVVAIQVLVLLVPNSHHEPMRSMK